MCSPPNDHQQISKNKLHMNFGLPGPLQTSFEPKREFFERSKLRPMRLQTSDNVLGFFKQIIWGVFVYPPSCLTIFKRVPPSTSKFSLVQCIFVAYALVCTASREVRKNLWTPTKTHFVIWGTIQSSCSVAQQTENGSRLT